LKYLVLDADRQANEALGAYYCFVPLSVYFAVQIISSRWWFSLKDLGTQHRITLLDSMISALAKKSFMFFVSMFHNSYLEYFVYASSS
jgi:hypothetical protein